MPPKKREKENEPPNSKHSKTENSNGDHEQFLQAFESKFLNIYHIFS